MKKIILFMLGMFLIAGVVAEVQSLGTFKRGEEVELLQIAAGFTSCNITSVLYPNSSCAICSEVEMTKNGNQYNYSFNKTNELGKYIVNGYCTDGSEDAVWSYDFEITPSGFSGTLGFYIIIITIGFLILLLGFYLSDEWVVILGTLILYFVGIFILVNGIAGIQNKTVTLAIGLVIVGLASYISIRTALEIIQSNY